MSYNCVVSATYHRGTVLGWSGPDKGGVCPSHYYPRMVRVSLDQGGIVCGACSSWYYPGVTVIPTSPLFGTPV